MQNRVGGEVFYVTAGQHREVGFFGSSIVPLADHSRTGGVEIFLMGGLEGSGPKAHAHDWDESYFMMAGSIELTIGTDAPRLLAEGELVYIPGGVVHAFRVTSPGTRFLSINSARGAAEFFADVSREMTETMNLPVRPASDDLRRFLALADQHRVRMAPPPASPPR